MPGLRIRPALELPALAQRTTDWPADVPLGHPDVLAALWHGAGNIREAARHLRCPPARLAALLKAEPHLADQRQLAAELQVDRAEHVLLEALEDDDDKIRRDDAARFIIQHAGRVRGWGRDGGAVNLAFGTTPSGTQATLQTGSAAVTVRWQTDDPPEPAPKMIDISPSK